MKNDKPKKPNRSFRERQYHLPESEIQELVIRAQGGDGLAQMQLLQIFENFLAIYINLLWDGKYNLKNLDTRRFLALFVKDWTIRAQLLRNKLQGFARGEVNDVVRGLISMTRRLEKDDIEQTVQMAFLHCLNVYKPTYNERGLIPFSGYIYAYFYYVLQKEVKTFLISQLGRHTYQLLGDDDDPWVDEEDMTHVGYHAPPGKTLEEVRQFKELDEHWINNALEGPFSILTSAERELMKWRFIDRLKIADISAKTGYSANKIREDTKLIKLKLQEFRENEQRELYNEFR